MTKKELQIKYAEDLYECRRQMEEQYQKEIQSILKNQKTEADRLEAVNKLIYSVAKSIEAMSNVFHEDGVIARYLKLR